MVRDKLLLEQISLNRCNSCLQFNHDILKCSMIHYYPDKSIFYKFTDIQQRQFKERSRYVKQKAVKIRESIRYDLILIRWHKVAEKNKVTNTRNLFNQLLTLNDNHFFKIIPKIKLYKRTNKEKHLKQLMLCSNLENVLAPPVQPPSIIEQRANVPHSTFIQVGPGNINSQLVYDRVHISDESNKLGGGIENVASSGTINRKSIKKESYHPTQQRTSISGQATQIGSISQFKSSQIISQQNFQNIFTQNYHGIYSNLSRSNSENVLSLLKNDAVSPNNNMLNAQEESYQNTSQLSAVQYPIDEDDVSKKRLSVNYIPQQDYHQQQQQQQTESVAPSHLIIPYGNKECHSGFSNIDFFENQAKSSQMDILIGSDKKQIIQRINSKKKTQNQLSLLNPLQQQSMHFDQKQMQKRPLLESSLQLEDEVYENYKFLKVFFTELNDKKTKRHSTKTSTFFMKERNLTSFDQNKSIKELRFMLQQIKRENDYQEHIFGPLEFTFDKIYQYRVYYPSFNYECVIEKLNLKITENQRLYKLKTQKSQKKKTIFSQQR